MLADVVRQGSLDVFIDRIGAAGLEVEDIIIRCGVGLGEDRHQTLETGGISALGEGDEDGDGLIRGRVWLGGQDGPAKCTHFEGWGETEVVEVKKLKDEDQRLELGRERSQLRRE